MTAEQRASLEEQIARATSAASRRTTESTGGTVVHRKATRAQVTAINAHMTSDLGLAAADRAEKLAILALFTGREITSSADLTAEEASRYIDSKDMINRVQTEEPS